MLSSSPELYVIGLPLASVFFFIIPICVLFFILLDLVIHLFPSLIFAFAFSSVNIFVPLISVMVSHFHVISSANIPTIFPWKIFLNLPFQNSFFFFNFLNFLFKETGIWNCCPDVWWLFVLNQSACSFGQEMFLSKNFNFKCALKIFSQAQGIYVDRCQIFSAWSRAEISGKNSAKLRFLLDLGQIISLWNSMN